MIKNAMLVAVSVVIAIVIFVGFFELTASYRYDQWKAEFGESGDWYGKLTIPSENSVLMWEYRPNASGDTMGATIQTNEHGFRDVSHPIEKPADTFRVALAGDSVTVGIGVEADSTFASQFAADANSAIAGKNIEALAFAIDGYSALQVMELIRAKAMAFSPDMVVYLMCLNDFDFDRSSGQKMKYFRKPDNFFLRTLERLYLKLPGADYYEYYYAKNQKEVMDEIVAVRDELAVAGIDFRVVIIPIFRPFGDSQGYSLAQLHDKIEVSLANLGISVADQRGPLSAADAHEKFAIDELHLNAAGHRLLSARLVDLIFGTQAEVAVY